MSSERHARVKQIFLAARAQPLATREAFLDQQCAGDEDLQREVQSLLLRLRDLPETDLAESMQGELDTDDAPTPFRVEVNRQALTIANYRVLQKIGEGGMGEVYEAEQQHPVRRRVALKVLKGGLATQQVIARFESERQALAMMNHPNIARVFEAGVTESGSPFFAMELVHGEPITDYCDRHRLTTNDRLTLFAKACVGVQHAHQKGIIHRDIKPSNVLVAIEDGQATPKIIDFGIAKATAQRLTDRTLFTELGQWIGTPEYMSPEQAEMTGLDIDPRTDVYSLGVLLYELLVGARPLDSEALRQAGLDEVRRRIREDEPTRPSTKVSGLGDDSKITARNRQADVATLVQQLRGDLDWITMKALAKDRTRRYASPADLAADLGRHLADEPVLAGPELASYRAIKFMRRHRVTIGVGFLMIALVTSAVLATIGLLHQQGGRQIPLEPEQQEASDSRVVVAVFENQTGDPTLDPVGRMASDLITQGLQRTGIVDVVPPATVLHASRYIRSRLETDGRSDPVNALARETGASLAVAGAYYRQGDSIQFNAQITQMTGSQSDRLISSVESVAGPIDEPTRAMEVLRQRVLGALASILDPRIEQPAEAMGHLPSYDAYKAFIEGLEIFWRGGYLESVRHFERATDLDPGYQMPRILSVFAYGNAGEWTQAERFLQDLENQRAELSPYEGYRLDQLQSIQRGDNEGAHRAALQAAAISPEFGPVFDGGTFAARLNRPREALAAFSTIDTTRVLIGWTNYWEELTAARHALGDHTAELKDARRGVAQYPDSFQMLFCEARAQAALGEKQEVRELMDRSVNLTTQPPWTAGQILRLVAFELEAHGHLEAAQETLARAITWYQHLPATEKEELSLDLADTLLAAGRVDEANRILETSAKKYLEQGEPIERIFYLGALGVVRARQGQRGAAQQIALSLETMNVGYVFGWPSLWQARIAAHLGDSEQAMILLRRAFAEGTSRGAWLHSDPHLKPLRADKLFQDLLIPTG